MSQEIVYIQSSITEEQFKIVLEWGDKDALTFFLDLLLDEFLKIKEHTIYIKEEQFDYSDKMRVNLTHPDDEETVIGYMLTKKIDIPYEQA